MASIYWVLLLLLPAVWSYEALKPDNVTLQQMAKLLQEVKDEMAKVKKLEKKLFQSKNAQADNMDDWQHELSAPVLDMLEKDLGSATIEKCRDYAKQRSADGNQKDINRNFRYCVMSEKWTKSVAGHGATRRSDADFKKFKNTMFDFDKTVDPSWKRVGDCMYMRKKGSSLLIPYHKKFCYWRFTYNRTTELSTFWKHAGPDLLYTYDFVLNTAQHDTPKQDSLWYIMAYIRMIALDLDNPMEIVRAVNEPIQSYKLLHTYVKSRTTMITKAAIYIVAAKVAKHLKKIRNKLVVPVPPGK